MKLTRLSSISSSYDARNWHSRYRKIPASHSDSGTANESLTITEVTAYTQMDATKPLKDIPN